MILVERMPKDQISGYGVIAAEPSGRASTASATWSRSRRREQAPSDLAIIGRYILTPDIFDALEETATAIGSEKFS